MESEEVLKFLGALLVMAVPFYLMLQLEPGFGFVQELVATNVKVFLLALGFAPLQQGYFLFLYGKGLEVAAACVGWRSLLAFASLVIATPRRPDKLRALVFLPVIYGFNIARLMTSLLASVFIPDGFDLVHGFLWTYAMTFLVLGLWWHWAKLGAQRRV